MKFTIHNKNDNLTLETPDNPDNPETPANPEKTSKPHNEFIRTYFIPL